MKTLRAWIEAVRLRTIPVSVAGVFTAWACSFIDGNFNPIPAVLCLFFAILCQVASNFANEYYDYKAGRDRRGREGPRRGVTEGDISPRQMAVAVYAVLFVAGCVGLAIAYFGGWWLIAVGAIIGLGALAYSTGPYPLSTHALGEVAVFLFFGIVPVCLTYYVQTHTINFLVVLAACSVGLMGANVLIVNNYRDIPDDMAVGKRTLSSIIGRRWSVILYIINAFIAACCILPLWQVVSRRWFIVPCLYVIISAVAAKKMDKLYGAKLTPFLANTARLMLVMSVGLLALAVFHHYAT